LELHAAQQHLQLPMTMSLAAAMNTILLSNDDVATLEEHY
jgi:hypothetical protein